MPFEFFRVRNEARLDDAKAKTVQDEVQLEMTKKQMNIFNKILVEESVFGKDRVCVEVIEGGVLKQTADSLKAFAAGEKVLSVEKEEVPNHWAHVRGAEMLVYYPRTAKQGDTYDDQTVNPGWLSFHNIKDLLARFFMTVHANYGKVGNWRGLCIGITSMDHGGDQMPMFDYDGKNIKTRVKKDIKQLQKQFGLGDATIYETRKGLHVYFFSNLVEREQYTEMLNSVVCCKGFKHSFEKNGYAVLRVSAKYTEFDILPYKVIISPNRGMTRPGRKAALIQELLRLGQECGTHFASLYPQWGRYQEDLAPWKPAGKKKPMRRIKKISHAEYKAKQKLRKEKMYKMTGFGAPNPPSNWGSTTTTATITTSGGYIVNTGDGTW